MKRFIVLASAIFICNLSLTAQTTQAHSTNKVVPEAFQGHWQKGVFSLSNFEQYDGKYIGPANETSLSYVIEEDGTAKEYFIANTNSYNCRTQTLGFRKGAIMIHSADNSFEFRPGEGYYTTVSCFTKTPTKKPYTSGELYPAYSVKGFLRKDNNGSYVLVTKRADGTEGLILQKMK